MDFDRLAKDLDAAKKRGQKLGDPAWRKLERRLEDKNTAELTSDFDDYTISTKIKLRNESGKLPAFGIKFGFQMPNTDQARGIGTNQINIFTKFIVQKKFGVAANRSPKANIFGNLGLGIMTAPLSQFSQNDVLLYGLAGIFRVNDRINLASEINGRVNTRSGEPPVGTDSLSAVRFGARFTKGPVRVDGAFIIGITERDPAWGFSTGATWVFRAFDVR